MIKYCFTIMLSLIAFYASAQIPQQVIDSVMYEGSQLTYDRDSIHSLTSADSAIQLLQESEEAIRTLSDSLGKYTTNPVDTFRADSIKNAYKTKIADSLENNKFKTSYDSLNTTVKENIENVSDIEKEQEKFFSNFSDSLQKAKGALDKGLNVKEIIEGYDQTQLQQLPPLNAKVIKQQNKPALDSLRQRYLNDEKLKYKEKELAEEYKEVMLKKKEPLFRRSFFEGIIGLNNDFKAIDFSPAFGIQLTRLLSLGLGPNLKINTNQPSNNILVGLRTFAKYEILENKLYIQIEDNSYWPGVSYPNWEDKLESSQINHTVLVGGGCLIKLSSSKNLNLAILYKVNENKFTSDFTSPMTVRLGMDFYKKK